MKCQRCAKQATYHITDVFAEEQFEELHLCEECAKKHLCEPTPQTKGSAKGAPVSEDDPHDIGSKQCAACGIKFIEFRNSGRLGCPHDYDTFKEELLPLLENIHGDVKHAGKLPRRLPRTKATLQELASLRLRQQIAITNEDYEEAARLRDQIKKLEEGDDTGSTRPAATADEAKSSKVEPKPSSTDPSKEG